MASWNIRGFNNPAKVTSCKNLIKNYNLDILFILEAKINNPVTMDSWFLASHTLFPHEDSYNNFSLSNPGRIWIKWNTQKVSFKPLFTSSQLIHGELLVGTAFVGNISVVYASNSITERQLLWNQLTHIAENMNAPWTILGDYNCCRFTHEKAGGIPLHSSKLGELNNFIFKSGMIDLASVGHSYTWFNQRTDNPIHIKLDRVLVNSHWLNVYPKSFYNVADPGISDHSPIILLDGSNFKRNHRFLFKNYWTKIPAFWDDIIAVFSQPDNASPICALYHKLKTLKQHIKRHNWNSSNTLKGKLDHFTELQKVILTQIQNNPLDHSLNNQLKEVNMKLSEANNNWINWIKQRDFHPLIRKLTSALDGWKAKCLSFAGRIQFLRYTIFSTVAYWIRGSYIPKGCCNTINKICSRFLFGGDITQKKLQMIAWKDTCLPKKYGGIGLPSIESLTHSFGCSLIWRFLHQDNFLFTWWKDHYHSLWYPHSTKNSNFWNHLSIIASKIKQCLTLRIHSTCSYSLLWDPWCKGKSIMEITPPPDANSISRTYMDWQVKNVIEHGNWLIPFDFNQNIVAEIIQIPITDAATGCLWFNTTSPNSKAYRMQYYSNLSEVSWYKYVWHKRYALRFSAYAWLAFKTGLKTADQLIRRGISVEAKCKFCAETETHSHLFFECDFSFHILKLLIPGFESLLLRPNLFQAYCFISEQNYSLDINYLYSLLIGATIYYIWRARNDRLYGNSADCPTSVAKTIKRAILFKTSH
ncbi:hypothetical protein M5K25_010734 [Dendrobium thyrsiflorum]|uniref:Reverse transcriptase zinc-binding domain-containing protein n=1 Tax=Dendrobium thyrsiflorum TaxID=117978 RepID=A0ABD0V7Z9_DENTH